MKKRYCIIPQILLLFWFFLDMTGIYFRNTYLVTRSYKDDGIFFLIYLVTIILFIFKEKIGKWAVAVWTSIWFVVQFLCHEWYTIFGKGIIGYIVYQTLFFHHFRSCGHSLVDVISRVLLEILFLLE